jgi:Na+/melibiose symporter-like transporter
MPSLQLGSRTILSFSSTRIYTRSGSLFLLLRLQDFHCGRRKASAQEASRNESVIPFLLWWGYGNMAITLKNHRKEMSSRLSITLCIILIFMTLSMNLSTSKFPFFLSFTLSDDERVLILLLYYIVLYFYILFCIFSLADHHRKDEFWTKQPTPSDVHTLCVSE